MRSSFLRKISLLFVVLFGWSLSRDPAVAQEPGPGNDGAGPVAEEVAEALEDLDEAGVPPTAEDAAAFVRELTIARPPRLGALSLRHGYRPLGGHTGSAGLTLGQGTWHIRIRGRIDPAGLATRAAVAGWDHPVVSLRVGHLGFRHGFGLLVAPPGRSSSLGADQPLGPRSARFVGWTGVFDSRTWVGVGIGLTHRRWRFHGLVGTDPLATGPSTRQARLLRLAVGGETGHLAAGFLATGTGRGFSLTGALSGSRYKGALEGVLWQNPNGRSDGWAAVAQAAWLPARGHRVEAVWVAADRREGWPAGQRPPVLLDWSGHGFALRARTTPARGTSVRGMWHQGWSLPGTGAGELARRRITELQWHQALTGTWDLAVRYRRTSKTGWEWSRRHPWLPAVPLLSSLRTVLSVGLVHDRGTWRVGALLRSMAKESSGGSGRRSLLGVQWRARPRPGWTVRFFGSTAWGDDVDLVTAVVPFTGLVLSRHWGKWRSGTGLGLERSGARWSIRFAGGVRRAEPGLGEVQDSWLRSAVDLRW